jgi:hypothetical protein
MAKAVELELSGPRGEGVAALIDADMFDELERYSWNLANNGYVFCRTRRRGQKSKVGIYLHRLVMRAQPGDRVDHRDGNPLNNVRANLRFCSQSQNCHNIVHSANQKRGGYKGVNWRKAREKWQVQIRAGEVGPDGRRRQVYLGQFDDPVEAARAYDVAARQFFGEFAALNFPDEGRAR